VRPKDLEALLPGLESADAFARLEAERRLRVLLSRDAGYRWDAAPADRAASLDRLRKRLAEEAKRSRARRGGFPGLAAVDLKALQGMSPQEMEGHLQELLGKAQVVAAAGHGRPRCQGCGKRPATVEIVEVRSRRARGVKRLCDPCAAAPGESKET